MAHPTAGAARVVARSARLMTVVFGTAILCTGQNAPGTRSFGTESFVEIIDGSLPIVLSAPHGGDLRPAAIPDRSYGVVSQDLHTMALARELAAALVARTGRHPHLVASHLHRIKLDPNREIVEAAQGNPDAERAWNEYHTAIGRARAQVTATWGSGLYVDLHGHGHSLQRIEWGYLLTASDYVRSDAALDASTFAVRSSMRHAAGLAGARLSQILRGPSSLGGLMEAFGYAGVPTPTTPDPGGAPYFSGGYSTQRWGSSTGGSIDGVQIEFDGDVRRTPSVRRAMVTRLADALVTWLDIHLGVVADADPKITVRALSPVLNETGAPGVLRFERTGPTTQSRAAFVSMSGTATPQADYTAVPGAIFFGAGIRTVDVPIAPVPDAIREGDETIRVQLRGGSEIGWPAFAELVLRDDLPDLSNMLHLQCDAVANGTTPDVSGRNRSGQQLAGAGGPIAIPNGAVDGALWFDGVNDGLTVNDHPYAAGGAFTLAFWFRTLPPAAGSSGFRYVFSHGANGTPSSLQVYFLESSRVLRTYLMFDNQRAPLDHIDVTDDWMDGRWHHYALSASAAGRTFVAIDGEVRAENAFSGDRFDPSGPLHFGCRSDLNAARFYAGGLDDMHIVSRALTEAEVRALRDSRLGSQETFGAACPPHAPLLQLLGAGIPETDRTVSIISFGAALRPTLLSIGLSDQTWLGQTLPLSLATLGAPGCSILQDLLAVSSTASDNAGRTEFAVRFPRDAGLVGVTVFTQAFQLNPSANLLGLATSSGLRMTLGGQD